MDDIPVPIPVGERRFIDDIRADMRARGYAYSTERTYLHWIKRYIVFNQRRHPKDMGKADIEAFLNYLAVEATVSPSTQRTALNALMYLYTKFYGRDPESLSFSFARPTRRLPTVLTHEEAKEVLSHMSGTPLLMTELLYGSGLRLHECITLRIKDIDFALNTITVRQGKGDKDRTTLLPASTRERLEIQIEKVLALHKQDLTDGNGEVYMPHALERKYPSATRGGNIFSFHAPWPRPSFGHYSPSPYSSHSTAQAHQSSRRKNPYS
jgi:site-specific recombinase XerD